MSKYGKPLIIIGSVAYVATIILTPIVVYMYWMHGQEQKLATAKTDVTIAVKTYNFSNETSKSSADAISGLQATIKRMTIKTSAPGQTQFEAKSATLQSQIGSLAEVATYSNAVGEHLAGKQFGGKFVSADDAASLAQKWQICNEALKKISPPSSLQKQHDVLVASTANQVVIATKASDAYKANDAATIAEQSKAAADELAKIQAVYDDVYAYVRAQQALIIVTTKKL